MYFSQVNSPATRRTTAVYLAPLLLVVMMLMCSGISAQTSSAAKTLYQTKTPSQTKPLLQNNILSQDGPAPKLVIVIDDLGNNLEYGRRAVDLPGAVTYAILPHTPLAKKLAFYATRVNHRKDIIIHMPMESINHKRLGPGGLETHQDQQAFVATLHKAFDAIPFAKGLSNHMGSKLTALPDRMQWLMTELGKTSLYFIDSKTTGSSTAHSAAANPKNPLPCTRYFS